MPPLSSIPKKWIQKALTRLGYRVERIRERKPQPAKYADLESHFLEAIHARCERFTLTPPSRTYALYQAVKYVAQHGIEGDFVECGVWKGGSAMVAALTFLEEGSSDRTLYLYDTFAGMSQPTEKDVDHMGRAAMAEWESSQLEDVNEWCLASFEEVEANLRSTGYPMSNVRLVRGRVEETIPREAPDAISILRLDTDWYESTYHELEHLYPRLSRFGVLIIDDYGYWQGAREATDRFFAERGERVLLHRIDRTCRVAIKLD